MKFLIRLGVSVIFLYIVMKLGLLELMMLMFITVGQVVWNIAKMNPTAAAIGVLIFIMMGGVNSIRSDSQEKNR